MKKAMPKVLIVMGALSLITAMALFIYSRVDDYLAGQRSESLLHQVLTDDEWDHLELTEVDSYFSSQERSAEALENTDDESDPDEEPGEPIRFSIIGILEIPKLKKRLPVLDRSTYALLNISVCRFSGSVEEKPVRLVISGHNLRSHFGEISTLSVGDEIRFSTKDGEVFRYKMINIEECHKSEGRAVQAGDDWDITLLTCKKDRTFRTLVRFKEVFD